MLCICLGGCAGLVDRHYKRTVDRTQGRSTLEGLREPVTIRRDAYGIPLVAAGNMQDLAMAIGYVNAADRLTQMVGMKLVSQGRLAEMAGPSVLSLDIYMRTMNLRQAAENLYKHTSPENQALLARYGDGVNAYVARHKDNLPPGLALAGYSPEPWQPMDSVMIFALVNLALSFNLHEEIAMLSIAQELGPEKTAWLAPIYPDEPLPFDEAAKLRDLDLQKAAGSISGLAELQPLLKSVGLAGLAASNNWAIAKEKTKANASILCNDMHLYLTMPAMYNMMHVRCGKLDAAGMNIAGLPAIVAGYNGHIAWGMTMVMADNQDLFLEQLKPVDGRLHYLHKGRWLPVTEREEHFLVKGEAPVTVVVQETVHGPLLNDALGKEPIHLFQAKNIALPYGIALSRVAAVEEDDSVNAFFRLSAAESVQEAGEIIRRIRAIPLNMVFADQRNIAWQVIGNYPVRAKGRGFMPSPGWTGEYDWSGLLDTSELPNALNPAAGFIGTANNRTIDKEYPHVLSSSWYWPERIERIVQMASASDRHTAETCKQMQLDSYSLFVPKLKAVLLNGTLAEAIVQEIDGWKDADRRAQAQKALAVLRDFDAEMRADSAGAALVSVFYDQASRNIFADELKGPDSQAWKAFLVLNNESFNATCDHLVVRGDESPFWDDIRTPEKETKAQILAATLADAAAFLEKRQGDDVKQWRWGALHTYVWQTDASQMAPHMGFFERLGLDLLWPYFNRGPYPAPGDHFTLNVSGYTMGQDFDTWLIPSMRMVVDFSLEEPMVAVNSSGQSDNPSSPNYADGIEAWREAKYIAFPFKEAAVKAQYKEVLVLQPASN
ncbi:MAG: penicillin acylase family protein [Desulfatitalea sp.]|nr:penicillin acylase family protein [Desulfatitalea sp.]